MFILRLRKVEDPACVQGVAHSESKQALEEFMLSEFSASGPRAVNKDGQMLIYFFKEGGPFSDYMPPNPGDEEVGITDLGDLETKIKEVLDVAMVQIEASVREEWQNVIDNTVKV